MICNLCREIRLLQMSSSVQPRSLLFRELVWGLVSGDPCMCVCVSVCVCVCVYGPFSQESKTPNSPNYVRMQVCGKRARVGRRPDETERRYHTYVWYLIVPYLVTYLLLYVPTVDCTYIRCYSKNASASRSQEASVREARALAS